MAPDDSTASTVTIERGYFETLVRRAQFREILIQKTTEVPVSRSSPNDAVTVSRTDHEALRQIAKQYDNLRRNLLRGGVKEETIELLSQDDATIQDGKPTPGAKLSGQRRPSFSSPTKVSLARSPQSPPSGGVNRKAFAGSGNGNLLNGFGFQRTNSAGRYQDQGWSELDAGQDDNSYSGDTPGDEPNMDGIGDRNGAESGAGQGVPTSGYRPHYERQCNRTLQLSNLPEGTTHADIAAVVRGGLLLDIFVRSHDKSATVSFLHAADAKAFFDHCRRHDLYVRSKRVDVRWNDRQFILPGHVASKIGIGATRNLVIRRCDPRITEETIREDMEHIHNLVIINVVFIGGSCFISTNSVHNAMFARTCMMSRFKFKGSKIDWDVDECAQPLERIQLPRARKEHAPAKKTNNSVTNRFQLLNLEDEDEDDAGAALPRAKDAIGIAA